MADDLSKEFLQVMKQSKDAVEWFGKLHAVQQKELYAYGK